MKYLEMPNILRTNALFSKLNALDPKQSVEIEVYSCKQTRQQKSHRDVQKPLRYYVSALEEAFGDYDFSGERGSSFHQTCYDFIRKELSFIFFTIYRNYDDVNEMLGFLDSILNQCVSIRSSMFYLIDDLFGNEAEKYKVFLIHDKKLRRVVIIKTLTRT